MRLKELKSDVLKPEDIKQVAQALFYQQITGHRAKALYKLVALLVLPGPNHGLSVKQISDLINTEIEYKLLRELNNAN